jgi:threonine synthase
VISTAHGLKFTEFKTRYHEEALGFATPLANRPVPMSGDPDQVVGELHRVLDARAG